MAQSRHTKLHCTCPLLGVKRTSLPHGKMSANDLGCVKTQKFEKRRELFSQIKQKRTRSRIPAAIIAIQKNVHSIAVARRYVFTQPRRSGHWLAGASPRVYGHACPPVYHFGSFAITAGFVEERPTSSPFASTLPSSAAIAAEPLNAPLRLSDATLSA